jgi:hypothetical protein
MKITPPQEDLAKFRLEQGDMQPHFFAAIISSLISNYVISPYFYGYLIRRDSFVGSHAESLTARYISHAIFG